MSTRTHRAQTLLIRDRLRYHDEELKKMRRRDQLEQSALDSAQFRGHKMSTFQRIIETTRSESVCSDCEAYVQVDTRPAPNGIDIGGTAIALNCTKRD